MIETWRDIPGYFDFQDIYDQAVAEAEDGDILIEVGTLFGKSAAYMAERIKESGRTLYFYVVDKWDEQEHARWRENVLKDPPTPWPVPELDGLSAWQAFDHCIRSVKATYVKGLPMSSVEAAGKLIDGAVKFVFIDADHTYENVRDDITAWLPKVKPGGIIAGHDYHRDNFPGVVRAVDERFPKIEHRKNSWLVRV